MAALTLPGVLLTGNHAGRPAASAAGRGALYSCTTHLLVYQTDGSSWTTWAALTGSGLTDPMTTRGDIIVRNASNATDRLGRGSAGKVLTSDGTDVSWQTPGSGGSVLLLEQHAASSSATLDFTAFLSSSYDQYRFVFSGLRPGTTNTDLWMRMGTGAGPTWDAGANYSYLGFYNGVGDSQTIRQAAAQNQLQLLSNQATTANHGVQGEMVLSVISGLMPYGFSRLSGAVGGSFYYWQQNLHYASATALTGVRFLFSSGTVASGTISVYGVKNS